MSRQNVTKLLFVIALLWGVSQVSQASGLRQHNIKNMLVDEALAQGISPALALAIAKVESDFNPYAVSRAGARGIMQLMPATALNGFNVASHDLDDAKINIRVGISYIKQLLEQYRGNLDIALSHYNGGSAVRRANGELRVIPATRNYVHKVKFYARQYANEYGLTPVYQQPTAPSMKTDKPVSGDLTYAQQMALDEQARPINAPARVRQPHQASHPDTATHSNSGLPEAYTQHAYARIGQLQQLREHNLTRVLGPKSRNSATGSAREHALPDADQTISQHDRLATSGAQRAYREILADTQQPVLSDKKLKVASWEAIYN